MPAIQQVMMAAVGGVIPPSGNQKVWLKADAIVGLNDGDQVSTWSDSSGNANDATGVVGAGATKPTYSAAGGPNSKPAVRISTAAVSSGYFTLPIDPLGSPTAGHAFAVVIIDADPPSGNARSGPPYGNFGASTDEYYPFDGDSKIYDGFGSSARKTTVNPTPSLTSWRLYETRSAAGAWSNWLDGTQLFTTAVNTVGWNAGAPRIGGSTTNSKTLNGLIAEVLMYDVILDATALATLKSYIATKYGLTLA